MGSPGPDNHLAGQHRPATTTGGRPCRWSGAAPWRWSPPSEQKDATIASARTDLGDPATGGAPEGHAQDTRSSVRARAKRLGRASAKTVGRLLKGMQSSLRTTVKRLAGKPPPPRDPQYRFLQRTKALFRRHGAPVLSIDAKQTERIGHCKNAGACWGIVPAAGNMYAFPSDAPGQATPYGLYDQVAHHA